MPKKQTPVEQLQLTFRAEKPAGGRASLPGGWWLWCLIGIGVGLGGWLISRQYLARELSQQLLDAKTRDQAVAAIEGLILLDSTASSGIVAGLQSEDFFVARTAFRTIDVQISRWEQLKRSEADTRLRSLATSLSALPSTTSADNLILASSLASRVFTICLDREDAQLRDVMDLCESVIGRAGQVQSSVNGSQPSSQAEEPVAASLSANVKFTDDSVPPPPLAPETLDSVAGIGTGPTVIVHDPVEDPISSLSPPPLTVSNAGEVASSSGSVRGAIRMIASPSRSGLYRVDDAGDTQATAPIDDASAMELEPEKQVTAPEPQAALVDYPEPSVQTLAGIERLPIKELVRLLGSVQPKIAQAAAMTLKKHGMTDAKLELAMALATGTEQHRLEIIEQISSRSDLDPRVWLIWMAQDGQTAVRARAVSELNSMLDVDVMRELRQQLNRERDPQVAQLIRQVLMTPTR